jgi:hypothetical protein
MQDAKSRWIVFIAVAVTGHAAAAAGRVAQASSPVAGAAPGAVVIARCGESALVVTPAANGAAATLHGVITSGPSRWSFTASVGLARVGARTRTITVEEIRTVERKRNKEATPAGLFIDVLLDERKVALRHASEGGGDPAYAHDLERCVFTADGEAALEAMVLPPTEPVGCAPEVVNAGYRTQVAQAEKLSEDDAVREAEALCEDHQKTIEARNRLEQAISDRAARDRIAARGAAVMKTEDARIKAWNRIDGCLGSEPANGQGVAALHDAEARTRACYAKIAPRP